MRFLKYIPNAKLLVTVALFISTHFEWCQASSVPCNFTADCSNNAFCGKYNNGNSFCVQKFFNICQNSSDCHPSAGKCVVVTQNGKLSRCSSSYAESCFCAPVEWDRFRYEGCDLNTAAIDTSFDKERYCVPCRLLTAQNVSSAKDICSTIYDFQAPPVGERGSYFHSCHDVDSCNYGFYCKGISKGYYSEKLEFNINVTNAGRCVPYDFIGCKFISPCLSSYSCVREPNQVQPMCVPSQSLKRVEPPIPEVSTIPRWPLLALAATEMVFIVFKSATLLRMEKQWLLFALVCFIIESVIGFLLTAIQTYAVKDFYWGGGYTRNGQVITFNPFIVALLFVFTETCVVISESLFIRRKMLGQKLDIVNSEGRFRSSLVCRVIVKWITITATVLPICSLKISSQLLRCLRFQESTTVHTRNHSELFNFLISCLRSLLHASCNLLIYITIMQHLQCSISIPKLSW